MGVVVGAVALPVFLHLTGLVSFHPLVAKAHLWADTAHNLTSCLSLAGAQAALPPGGALPTFAPPSRQGGFWWGLTDTGCGVRRRRLRSADEPPAIPVSVSVDEAFRRIGEEAEANPKALARAVAATQSERPTSQRSVARYELGQVENLFDENGSVRDDDFYSREQDQKYRTQILAEHRGNGTSFWYSNNGSLPTAECETNARTCGFSHSRNYWSRCLAMYSEAARLKWHQNLALSTRDERRLYQTRRVMEHFSPVEVVDSVHLSAPGRPEKGPPKVYTKYTGTAAKARKASSAPKERNWGTHDDEPPPDLTERLQAFLKDDSNTFKNLDTDPSQASRTLLDWNKLAPGDNPPRSRERRSVITDPKMLDFRAYDCGNPTDVRSVTTAPDASCEEQRELDTVRNSTYLLLQEAEKTRLTIHRCFQTTSRMSSVCNFPTGHTTTVMGDWYFIRTTPIPVSTCLEWYTERKFGNYQSLTWNATNYVSSHSNAGYQWGVSADVHCSGARGYYKPGFTLSGADHVKNLMIYYHHTIVLETLSGYVDATHQRVHVDGLDITLPCGVKKERCATDRHGTFLWERPYDDELCPLYLSRGPVQGVDLTDSVGLTAFMSTDGSHLRLTKKEPTSRCGAIVYPTDFSELFLTTEMSYKPFLHPSEISITTYSNAKDKWLFSQTTKERNEALLALQQRECKRDVRVRAGQYALRAAEQGALADGETASLGDGHFITSSGEVFYSYRCCPITVRARQTSDNKCYDALPVTLREADYQAYYKSRGFAEAESKAKLARNRARQNASAPSTPNDDSGSRLRKDQPVPRDGFFMEPKTHRLLTTANQIICSPPFHPIYRNAMHNWLEYSPSNYRMAAPPIVAAGEKFDLDTLLIDTVDERDYEDGGPASFIDMRAFEIYTQAPRGGTATAIQIWENTAQDSSPYGAEHFFPDLGGLNETIQSGALGFLSWFYTFMEVWGKVCSFFIGTYLAYQLLSWVGGVVCRLLTLRAAGNPCMHVIYVCCPSFGDLIRQPGNIVRQLCFPKPFRPPKTREDAERGSYVMVKLTEEEKKERRRQRRAEWHQHQEKLMELFAARVASVLEVTLEHILQRHPALQLPPLEAAELPGEATTLPRAPAACTISSLLPPDYNLAEELQKAARDLPYPPMP